MRILSLLLFGLVFVSCNNDNDDLSPNVSARADIGTHLPEFNLPDDALIGTKWESIHTYDGVDYVNTLVFNQNEFILNNYECAKIKIVDGDNITYETQIWQYESTGSFSISGVEITMIIEKTNSLNLYGKTLNYTLIGTSMSDSIFNWNFVAN